MTTTPTPYFTLVTAEGKNHEVFMAFGLLNTLTGYFRSSLDDLPMLFLDPQVRSTVLVECLSKRDARGRILEEFNTYTVSFVDDSLDGFFAWVEAHITNFFMRTQRMALRSTKERVKASQT